MQYQRSLGPLQGIAMTVTTFVGTGLMVLPAMSVSQAGSFAFFAWLITAAAILPIAFVFAIMGSRFPSAGGASHYIGQAFGKRLERAVGWLFLSILLVGPAVAIKVAAAYLAILLDVNEKNIFTLSLITLLGMLIFSIAGLKNSARFQTLVVLLLIEAVTFLAFVGDIGSAISLVKLPISGAELHPTLLATGTIFWCFLGIEVMAHMGNEFKNPTRDFPIALLGGIGIVVALYLTLVLLIAYHHTFGDEITNSQSLALLIGKLLGDEYKQAFSFFAYTIAFANVGVYILGFTRMVQSLAVQKALPHYFSKLNHKGTPIRAVSLVGIICFLSLALAEYCDLTMTWFIEMTNGSFLLIYLLTCVTAIWLFKKQERWLACIASISCLFIVSFIGQNMLFAGLMFSLAVAWEFHRTHKSHAKEIHVQ